MTIVNIKSWNNWSVYLFSVVCEPGMCGINCTEDYGHSTQKSKPENVDGVCEDKCENGNYRQSKVSTYIYVVC